MQSRWQTKSAWLPSRPRHWSGTRQHAWLADGAAHTHGLASKQNFTSRQHAVRQAADLQEALGCAEDHSQGVLRKLWGDLGVLLEDLGELLLVLEAL